MPLDSLKEPKRRDLTIVTGDSFKLVVRLSETNSGTKTPIDLTGYEAAAQLRDAPRQRLLADFTATVTDAVNGEITLSLTTSQTACLTADGAWDLQVRLIANPTNNTHTLLYGTARVFLDNTKPT